MKKLIFILAALCLLTPVRADEFDLRGMHIDMRAQVMTMPALYKLADRSAELGMNALLMEWEGSFPFKENATIRNRYAYTEKEVTDFISYCASKGIEVIPLQNCFGHMEYILQHQRYAKIRENNSNAFLFSQVCPTVADIPEEVFESIFRDVARLHPSKYFHIGCDETRLLGACRGCKAEMEKIGPSALFCQYVSRMCKIVSDMGKIPVIWGDIVLKYPEAVEMLPKDLIIMDWNYGWKVDHFGKLENMEEAGLELWGATSLRSNPDHIYTTDWMKHFNNLTTYVPFMREKGAKVMFNTSWSTSGVYGFTLDNSDNRDVIEIQPLRQCYPLSAYDILIAAFAKATGSDEVFDPKSFIYEYCAERYGFDEQECAVMYDYFSLAQPMPYFWNQKPEEVIPASLEETLALRERFAGLKARSHRDEFAHFGLMLDFRINWLKWRIAEMKYESPEGTQENLGAIHSEIKPVLREAYRLRRRYVRMNRDYLKDPMASSVGEQGYIHKMEKVYGLTR